MKKLIYILPLIFLSACVSQQKCYNKFPPKVIVKDSIVHRKIYVPVHDTIPFMLPPDTIRDSVPVPCKQGKVKDVSLIKESELAKAHAYTRKGKLYLDLMQKDTIINKIIDDSIQTYVKDHYHFEQIKPQEIVKWKVRWYDRAARNIVGGELIIIAIFLLIKFGPKLLKLFF